MRTGKHVPHSIAEIQQVHAQARPHVAALSHGRHSNRYACATRRQIWNMVDVNIGMPVMPWHSAGGSSVPAPPHGGAGCHRCANSRLCSQCLWDWDIACAQTGVPSTGTQQECRQPAHFPPHLPAGAAGLEARQRSRFWVRAYTQTAAAESH